MSRQENPDYFGKSAFSPLQGVADAARKVMMGETQEEEKQEEEHEEQAEIEGEVSPDDGDENANYNGEGDDEASDDDMPDEGEDEIEEGSDVTIQEPLATQVTHVNSHQELPAGGTYDSSTGTTWYVLPDGNKWWMQEDQSFVLYQSENTSEDKG